MSTRDDPELSPLIGAVPVEGPAAVLLAGPWILLALLAAGPFALLITLVVALIVGALVVVGLAAIAASPYLLVRHLRAARARRETSRALAEPAPAKADRALLPKVSAPGY
jgi:hypothetical protein